MKIEMNVNKAVDIYKNNTKIDLNKSRVSKKDTIEISSKGKELSEYVKIAKDTELKNDKVDRIKKLAAEKNYKVDSYKLADSMIQYIKESDK